MKLKHFDEPATSAPLPRVRRWRLPVFGDTIHVMESTMCRITLNFGPAVVFESRFEGMDSHLVRFEHEGLLFLPPGPTPVLSLQARRPFPPSTGGSREQMLALLFDPSLFEEARCQLGQPTSALRPMSLQLNALGLPLARALAALMQSRLPASRALAEQTALALAIWVLERRDDVSMDTVERQRAATAMERVLSRIEADLERDLSLQALADEAGMSVYHFARSFKRQTGQTPHQYVMRSRLARAQRLLLDCALGQRDISIGEIALEVGFSSHSHMNAAFRRVLGCSPSDWLLANTGGGAPG